MDGPAVEPDVRVVLVTAPAQAATALARTVVEEGLAACANVLPGATSVYRWEGRVQEDAEALLVLKTSAKGVPALRARVVDLHEYDLPEFLVLDVADGLPGYLAWVVSETGGGS